LGVIDLGHTAGVILSGDAEKKRVTVSRRETEGYLRWKEKHGDAPRPPDEVDWDRPVPDDVQRAYGPVPGHHACLAESAQVGSPGEASESHRRLIMFLEPRQKF
jgi:hypothetical protein